ncbi:Ti-type conjugative transfer relaxase TraA [Brucella pseudogrignonensis]|uniref:Ti-type conjugative transfer relaxase TraA n=1 Tax=Brucella pseudogrignonensis TaxID=419475 RepID=UPI00178C6ED8|nr:Ti-type conjugative transfer relaxase TraA [Brucella pseudogrignonensis]
MTMMFIRAQVISRGAGRSVVSAAAYRHRARMFDKRSGTSFSFRDGTNELKHEEIALPEEIPAWLRSAVVGKSVAAASEALWNAVDAYETRVDAQLARELIIALPEELTRSENIALVQEFVRDNLTSKGMIADWVYHDKDGNPHIHLMTALRPLTEDGFGRKNVPVLGADGKPLRVIKPDRPDGKIVYKLWAGDKETMKAWKIAWAETANRYLSLAGHDIRLDGRSYAEQGLEGIAQKHIGPQKAALQRKGVELYSNPAELARRQNIVDRLMVNPGLLLKQLANERSTFHEKDIARVLHRYVDDPSDYANIRARLMASDNLVLLKSQQVDSQTGKVTEPAIFTTREILRIEYDMARSAEALSKRKGFGIADARIDRAVRSFEKADPKKPLVLYREQIDAVRHILGEKGIAAVVGLAGAGKTTLLCVARSAWEGEHRRVFGAALSGKAAEGLEDSSGIKSRTLASWELAWENGRDLLKQGDVMIVDEAGMVSSQQMSRVLKTTESAGAKVVLVGDAMQLQPIQAGAAFRAITERIGFAELSDVRRQGEVWARDASKLLAQGKIREGLEAYAENGHIFEAKRRSEAIERIVADWSEARQQAITKSAAERNGGSLHGHEMLVLAHTNEDVKRLNSSLRNVVKREGALKDVRKFRTARGIREFGCGDRIIFLENSRFFEKHAPHSDPQYVKNGMLGTVVSTGNKQGSPLLTIRLDDGRSVVLSENSYRNIDHGYAVTIHKSQGSTVDRAFVLATGMMDQHLTYVSMTRHRDRADIYAAREDFEMNAEWWRKSRVDYGLGIAGGLVETGLAKFGHQNERSEQSPYADVKTNDGTVHRLWGVSLPQALSAGGVSEGDTVLLKKDGVEIVKVKIPVIDKETGQKSFEERQVERNVWTAKQLETAALRLARIERESHRPELFGQLVERLSRSGAKTTTLDFENDAGYRAHAHDFARRRGIDTLARGVASIEERVGQKLAWLDNKRGQVTKLWDRANIALGMAIEVAKSISYDEKRWQTEIRGAQSNVAARKDRLEMAAASDRLEPRHERCAMPPMLSGIQQFNIPLEEEARSRAVAMAQYIQNRAALIRTAAQIWRDPAGAASQIEDLILKGISGERIAAAVSNEPEAYGELRGSGRIMHKLLAGGRERKKAIRAVNEAESRITSLAAFYKTALESKLEVISEERRRMGIAIPGISAAAEDTLRQLSAEIESKNTKIDIVASSFDAGIWQEFTRVSRALDLRFGRDAILRSEKSIVDAIPKPQRPAFEEMQKRLKLLQQIVRMGNVGQIVAERQRRSLERGQSIQR